MIEIPTALTDAELALLTRLARDARGLVYEAGALLGASTIALARGATFVVSVDPHDGYPRRNPSPTWQAFLDNIAKAGVASRIQPVRAGFEDAPPDAAYGLAFADLTGEAAITRRFLQRTMHVPVVAVHDYNRAGCEGATDAVDQFIKVTNPRYVDRVDTLIVMERWGERR